jgi:hypothetical protein
VRSIELLSSEEKLMAGLPNFATYFGRDMLMTALMMRPVWQPGMAEHVIASVLRKLSPRGDVSHEEALGGQAIRENGAEYNGLMAVYFEAARRPAAAPVDSGRAVSPALCDSIRVILSEANEPKQRADAFASLGMTPGDLSRCALEQARGILRNLQKTRENYHMLDDEFQLPILEARYLADSTVPADRRRAFLLESQDGGPTRLALMLRELALVAAETLPYTRDPQATNLVGFVKRDSTHWRSASWRDSDAGYANGRFAMDINAIWAPRALEAIAASGRPCPPSASAGGRSTRSRRRPRRDHWVSTWRTRPRSATPSISGTAPGATLPSRSRARRSSGRSGRSWPGCPRPSGPTGSR